LKFEFVSTATSRARIDVYDALSRLVQTVFDKPVESGVNYNAEFVPKSKVNTMYFYRMILGDKVYNGKVVYSKQIVH